MSQRRLFLVLSMLLCSSGCREATTVAQQTTLAAYYEQSAIYHAEEYRGLATHGFYFDSGLATSSLQQLREDLSARGLLIHRKIRLSSLPSENHTFVNDFLEFQSYIHGRDIAIFSLPDTNEAFLESWLAPAENDLLTLFIHNHPEQFP